MDITPHLRAGVLALAICVSGARAQTLPGPPVRALGPVLASSTLDFGIIRQLRPLSDGRVLVNDGERRLIWLLDPSLRSPRILLDSVAGHPNSYGAMSSVLIAGIADTTLFVDRGSQGLLVIDPQGTIARVMPVPPSPAGALPPAIAATQMLARMNSAAVSSRLGLVFQSQLTTLPVPAQPNPADSVVITFEDSAAVIRMDIASRAVDTVMKVGTGNLTRDSYVGTRLAKYEAVPVLFLENNPWVVTTDGSIAVLHEREYRITWVNPDGTKSDSPRIPYPWQPLTDADKRRVVDSVNASEQTHYDDALARFRSDSAAGRAGPGGRAGPAGRAGQAGQAGRAGPGGLLVTPGGRAGGPAGRGNPRPSPPDHYDVSTLPDYLPAINRTQAILPDGDNNIWVHINVPGQPPGVDIYDVINRKGELIDRIKLPEGHTLIGLGSGGTVYLIGHDAGKAVLEKAMRR